MEGRSCLGMSERREKFCCCRGEQRTQQRRHTIHNFLEVQPTLAPKKSQRLKDVGMGSGCGAVGRVVVSNTRGPRFKSSHRQLLLNIYLLLTVCRKDENKEKEARNGPFLEKKHYSVFKMVLINYICLLKY